MCRHGCRIHAGHSDRAWGCKAELELPGPASQALRAPRGDGAGSSLEGGWLFVLPPASRPHPPQTSSDTPWIPGPVADRPWTSIFPECPGCLHLRPAQTAMCLAPHPLLLPHPLSSTQMSNPQAKPRVSPPHAPHPAVAESCLVSEPSLILSCVTSAGVCQSPDLVLCAPTAATPVSCSADHSRSYKSEFKVVCDLARLTS